MPMMEQAFDGIDDKSVSGKSLQNFGCYCNTGSRRLTGGDEDGEGEGMLVTDITTS